MRRPLTRPVRIGFAALACLLLLAGCSLLPRIQPEPTPERVVLALLALGDTGRPPDRPDQYPGQLAVARALAAADRRQPVDLLLFLGDNFYPRGLFEHELEPRIAANLVAPYCHFAALEGTCSAAVSAACTEPPEARHPIPLFAVLGNHDHGDRESPRLQRERIPCYLSNWRVGADPVETVELGSGISLILYDSTRVRAGEGGAELTRALRESRGPWRVLAAHHPLDETPGSAPILDAISATGVPVQLHLSGHQHDLQIGTPSAGPALQVVAGGGSLGQRSPRTILDRRFQRSSPGFARVELVEADGWNRLRVSLTSVDTGLLARWRSPHQVALWSVGVDGDVRDELARAGR